MRLPRADKFKRRLLKYRGVSMDFLPNSREMKQYDKNTIEYFGVPALVLMERAALAVVDEIKKQKIFAEKILVAAGTGNNGGDGIAAGRLLKQEGHEVVIALIGEHEKMSEETKHQLHIAKKYGLTVTDKIPECEYNIVIDSLFGIGLSREVSGVYAEAISDINSIDGFKIALDVPSGVCADNGKILGTAVKADLTVTFAFSKPGLILYPGTEYAGNVIVRDIGITEASFLENPPFLHTFQKEALKYLLPKRAAYSNKGTYGRILVIAGSIGMAGAAYFAAKSALLSGAGLVRIYTPEENRLILQNLLPAAVLSVYQGKNYDAEKLQEALEWADAVVLGPGIGREKAAGLLAEEVIRSAEVPLVVDADALFYFAKYPDCLINHKAAVVLTPHLKELANLLKKELTDVTGDIIACAVEAAKSFHAICVAKDARTVVADGKEAVYLNRTGNHGMAAGGSGDVLTGIIAAFLAQGMEGMAAAETAVCLHGMAGDYAAARFGHRSMGPEELLDGLTAVLAEDLTVC